jgi:uncharacterized protein DUF222
MTAEDWEAWCDATAMLDDEPPDLGWDDEDQDPELAPGERVAWTAGFAKGGDADAMAAGSALAFLAGAAAGDDDRYLGATDAELDGVIAAWDRVEAHASARKHLAVAEFIRRRPEKGCEPAVPGGMPARWDEFAADELRVLLAESKAAVERMMDRAHALAARLPGTMAAFRSGKLRQSKVTIIADATVPLDDEESRAAEERVLGRAGRLTPGGLCHAIAQAVMDVAPEKARKRRQATGTPRSTAAPGPSPRPARHPGATPDAGTGTNHSRRPGSGTGRGPGSASPARTGRGRRAGSGPGGCAPPAPART